MLKKHLFLVMLLVMAALSSSAGTWKMHNYYVEKKVQNIFDAGDKVYYLNSNNLFQYDKATHVSVALNKQNVLSDSRISQIYYDWENRLLFVAYTNSNIDVIDSLGKVTNIPNIKDMIAPVQGYSISNGDLASYVSKGIKDITFGKGVAYVTVGYGFVTIDESTLKVIRNYDLGSRTISVNTVCLMGDTLLIFSNNRCYYGEPGDPHPTKTYKSVTGSFSNRKSYPLNGHSVFLYHSNGLQRYDFAGETPTLTSLVGSSVTNVQKSSTGFYVNFAGVATCYSVNPEGTVATRESSVITCMSSDPLGDGTIWVTDANGLHVKGSTDYYKINSLTTDAPYWLKYNSTLNKLYVGVSGPNKINNISETGIANVINTYDGTTWANATAYTASGAGYDFVFSPIDPHTYVRASWSSGIFKVTDDVKKTQYTKSNSMISNNKPHPAFDKYGNLWVVSPYNAADNPCVVLTKDKVPMTTVTKNDWFVPDGLTALNTRSIQRSRFLVSNKNNVKIFSDCDYPTGSVVGHVICWDNDNENPLVGDYHIVSIAHFVDQNNSQVSWQNLIHFEEDKDGLIWIGHTAGLFVLDPDEVFEEMPHVVRPLVTKFSEGKGYLCDGYMVYDIGVDRENNKWIASNNGLYYVSSDGSEVFNHFTIENSDIPSDMVYSVECDTVNDRIYIVTDNGFAEYVTHGDAAALDFDNVYAFPNPVEPDFTGMIKITGLMENSYVTVTDRTGAVVAQFGPVMGSAFWDGSAANGERVPTGVYNIYAAQGGQPATTGTPQATVMIIK